MTPGVVLSLSTALLWALSPLLMASAARRIGAFRVAALRSIAATGILIVILAVYLALVPAARRAPSMPCLGWLAISALFGMVIGDAAGYEAFVLLGPRRVTQIGMLAPVFSALGAWVFLREGLSMRAIVGIAVVLAATALAAMDGASAQQRDPGRVSGRGVAMALLSAAGTGLGAVAIRYAYALAPKEAPLDPLVATGVRVAASAIGLGAVLLVRGDLAPSVAALADAHLLRRFVPGVIAGSVAGMLCYVAALQLAPAGIVSALAATSPLFILPMVCWRYKARIGWRVFAATAAGCAGIAWIGVPAIAAHVAQFIRIIAGR